MIWTECRKQWEVDFTEDILDRFPSSAVEALFQAFVLKCLMVFKLKRVSAYFPFTECLLGLK